MGKGLGRLEVGRRHPPSEASTRNVLSATWKRIFNRAQPRWHHDLGLPSLQNCDKYICVV